MYKIPARRWQKKKELPARKNLTNFGFRPQEVNYRVSPRSKIISKHSCKVPRCWFRGTQAQLKRHELIKHCQKKTADGSLPKCWDMKLKKNEIARED